MPDFQLQIYTQEKKIFEGEVTSLIAPAEDGYVGVMANHAPLLTTLGEGKLTIRQGANTRENRMAGGFLEVHDNHATILADTLT